MRVLILAAGIGSRLGAEIPKILVKVAGKTILSRHVESLAAVGISPGEVTVITGYRSGDVADSCRALGMNALFNPHWDTPGTFSSFFVFPATDNPLLIIHGDLVWEAGLAPGTLENRGDIVVPVDPRNRADEEAMKAEVRGSRLLHLSKSLRVSRSAGESMGMFLVRNHRVLRRFSACLSEDSLASFDDAVNLVAASFEVRPLITDKFVWEEIDTPEDLTLAERKFS